MSYIFIGEYIVELLRIIQLMERAGFPQDSEQYQKILELIDQVKILSTEFCKTESIGHFKKTTAPPPPPLVALEKKTCKSTPRGTPCTTPKIDRKGSENTSKIINNKYQQGVKYVTLDISSCVDENFTDHSTISYGSLSGTPTTVVKKEDSFRKLKGGEDDAVRNASVKLVEKSNNIMQSISKELLTQAKSKKKNSNDLSRSSNGTPRRSKSSKNSSGSNHLHNALQKKIETAANTILSSDSSIGNNSDQPHNWEPINMNTYNDSICNDSTDNISATNNSTYKGVFSNF